MTWKPQVRREVLTISDERVAGLAALFDDGIPAPGIGDALPPLWHWAALTRWPDSGSLGTDGHPRQGPFMPPIALPRRMFAGGEVTFLRPVRVGAEVEVQSTVVGVEDKSSRSGPMTIVRVETTLADDLGKVAVEERQDIVYLKPTRGGSNEPSLRPLGGPARPFESEGIDRVRLRTDPTLLMRFSALTCNPHRIHYDESYARLAEGYPGLVVHGPLMAVSQAEAVRLLHPSEQVRRLRHRGRAPLFCGNDAWIRVEEVPDSDSLAVVLEGPDKNEDTTTRATVDVELNRPDNSPKDNHE